MHSIASLRVIRNVRVNMRRILLYLISVLLAGCTAHLWIAPDTYTETITGFYIAQEKNLLIVSGKKYGYTFEIEPNLERLLLDHKSKDMIILYVDFSVDEKNRVTGDIEFLVRSDEFTEEEDAYFSSLGLSGGGTRYKFETTLSGERYKIEGTLPFVEMKQERIVYVKRPAKPIDTVNKIVATPLTVTVDAVVVPVVAVGFGAVATVAASEELIYTTGDVLFEKNSNGGNNTP